MPESSKADFIRAHTRLLDVPHAPEIRLYLADEATELWQKTEAELGEMGLPPPFWAFAWAGGQALARYLLDHPALVRGHSVLDLASGSGLVAIAAAKAGAATVTVSEIDPLAVAAIALNVEANEVVLAGVTGDVLNGSGAENEVVLAGDVFYEQPMAERVLPFLERASTRGAAVLIGDPGRDYFPRSRFQALATYEVPVSRAIEGAEIMRTTVWKLV